jgi:phosphoribosylformylglycinamidine synthase
MNMIEAIVQKIRDELLGQLNSDTDAIERRLVDHTFIDEPLVANPYYLSFNQKLGLEAEDSQQHPSTDLEAGDDLDDDDYPLLDQSIPNGLKSVYKLENILQTRRLKSKLTDITLTRFTLPVYWLNDPYAAGQRAAAELYREIASGAARPANYGVKITLANMSDKTTPIAQFLQGLHEASASLDFPAASECLDIETDQAALSITLFGLGVFDETQAAALPNQFTKEDQHIYILGREHGHIGLSAYVHDAHNAEEGFMPSVHFDREIKLAAFIANMHKQGYLSACHSVSIGGIGLALADMAVQSSIGAGVGGIGSASFWYGEDQARYIVTLNTADMAKFEVAAQDESISLVEIGNTEEDVLSFNNQKIEISELK